MFNSFPQPKPDAAEGINLQDWSAYTTVYNLTGATTSVPASSWNTFVDITGKGYFKWCRIDASFDPGAANPLIRITIDGVPYTFDTPNTGSPIQGNEVSFEIPFKTSLKIEGFNRYTSATTISCDYLYLLQQSTPTKGITLLSQSQRKMAYLSDTLTTLADVVNITGSGYLLGIRFGGYYSAGGGYVKGDIVVDGVQAMTDRSLFNTGSATAKQSEVVGPIRFNSSLRIRTRVASATGFFYVCMAWYTLD